MFVIYYTELVLVVCMMIDTFFSNLLKEIGCSTTAFSFNKKKKKKKLLSRFSFLVVYYFSFLSYENRMLSTFQQNFNFKICL